jgi:transposase
MGRVVSRQILERAYRKEEDADTRVRILLSLRVRFQKIIPAEASREVHRSRAWATKWLRRFDEDGLDGLRTRERSGRPPKMPHTMMAAVERMVTGNNNGWTVKEVKQLIRKEADTVYSERHLYRLMHRWRMRPVVPEKRPLKKASRSERLSFKKE